MSVMTVRGPVAASELGYTLSHEHLLCDLWKIARTYDGILDDVDLAIEELSDYVAAGGRTVIDVTSGGLGRNPLALRRISEEAGVHIVMGAAWYREDVYPAFVRETDTNALAERIVAELTGGVDGTDIKAGVIGEIGTERGYITPAQERVFRASARAHRKTGALIVTHTTHFGELALEQIALLREEGVEPSRIAISHLGDRMSSGLLLSIARQGVYLSIDNIGYRGDGYPDDKVRAINVRRLVDEGHLNQIMLSGDICMKSHLRSYGGKGYAHVPRMFLPLLRNVGITDDQIRRMTVTNPARALDMGEHGRAAASGGERPAETR
jgi:predicted metal-dependent phosphotriesterase family hydrolase